MAMITMGDVKPLFDATSLLSDPIRLQDRARQEGYLYFKGLIDPLPILKLRQQILQVCLEQGWLDDGFPLDEGIVKKGESYIESDTPDWRSFYCDVQKHHDFHALALHPSLLDMFEKLFAEGVLPHSRNICRAIFPASETFTTPPHQDHFPIGGTEESWTAWIPIGDCGAEMGGLAVAPGSQRRGFLEVHSAKGAGGRTVDVEADATWASGDMLCGDVLIFHSLTVHQGRDNQTPDRLRVSCDFRYQPMSHPVREASLLPHMRWQTWDEIYESWPQDDPVRYYWKDWDLNVVP